MITAPRNSQSVAIIIGVLITFWASAIKGSYQVYFVDLTEFFSLDRGHFSLTSAIFGLSIGVLSPIVGAICDRVGPSATILSGSLSATFIYLLFSFELDFITFLVLFGVLAAYALTAMTFVPLALIVDKLFESENKGMAYAAITNGTAVGFMVLSPLWVWLNTFLTWQEVSLVIFSVFMLVITPASIWLCRRLPKIKFQSDKGEKDDDFSADNALSKNNVRALLTKSTFLFLALSFSGCGASMAYIDVHLVPLLQDRFMDDTNQTSIVAATLSFLGAAELIGAFIVGYILRFLQASHILAALYIIRALSLVILLVADNLILCLIFSVLFGLTYMGTVIITSLLCLESYGQRIKGQMFGFLFTVHQILVFSTIWLGAFLYDITGDYQLITYLVIGLCLVSSGASLVYRKKEMAKEQDTAPFTSTP